MSRELQKYQTVEQSINKKFSKRLWRPFIAALKQYELIQAGDKIAVCMSGGKDSFLLAVLMRMLQKQSEARGVTLLLYIVITAALYAWVVLTL